MGEKNSTNKNQIQEDDLSPDEDFSDTEESRTLTIKLSILSSRKVTKKPMNFLIPNTCSTSRQKGSLLVKNLFAWWNENHPDCQITVDSIKKWTYREDQDPSTYNFHWSEYGD
ncbi:10226_t:CDS:2 [Funneliformis caledonium]|uniref:10226_t:CDS:1 n=1 Tax=Funneliformis caledonium TaxID=1117310 RepID=A0A9N9GN95_9GLOM|nr:10226_t:CDS:2 [Funneliformis caledonium]